MCPLSKKKIKRLYWLPINPTIEWGTFGKHSNPVEKSSKETTTRTTKQGMKEVLNEWPVLGSFKGETKWLKKNYSVLPVPM